MVSEKIIDGLDGNGLLKAYVSSMEGKMAAGAFGRARSYGWDGPFKITSIIFIPFVIPNAIFFGVATLAFVWFYLVFMKRLVCINGFIVVINETENDQKFRQPTHNRIVKTNFIVFFEREIKPTYKLYRLNSMTSRQRLQFPILGITGSQIKYNGELSISVSHNQKNILSGVCNAIDNILRQTWEL